MLALGMSSNSSPYTSLIDRNVGNCSQKAFRPPERQRMPMFNFPKQHHAATTNQRQNLNPLLDSGKIEWKPEHFPHKMYDLLEDVEQKNLDDIVSWLPDGESFKIHSQVGFEQTIMPMYFSGMSSYKSFRRQLNLYGIYQHRHRPKQDPNAYSHKLLIRGQRHLCDKIARKKTNPPSKSKAPSKKESAEQKTGLLVRKRRGRSSLRAMMEERNNMKSTPSSLEQGVTEGERQDSSDLLTPKPSETSSTDQLKSSTVSDDIVRRNMLMETMYNESSTIPKIINTRGILGTRNNSRNKKKKRGSNTNITSNSVFESFMGQKWDDLPPGVSSIQIVDEIIATFRER
mmetsp:Transcript_10447/g.21995  ORF Transcript_10447/g.21995 Transcript_10447/m.21995 type:complete len:343 (-) Transcript_10447:368-1396(-)|eukprot:CAMPEP_0201123030 /NCGR_PEP_ID=MMETSP0850-20130426/6511_1 /ASSEMBLY_ACC=CAM_ASM_000622 /TAXON_ID=183588 /ORGANISM="Pseudo-nitzschia fraudulenta, Strain WWA7" /LENGTH=342 /DNA_ID=CAMNT_0047389837 /DNA_START=545 /DNA_END=1573 /DNA_ORIENTATION=-